MGAKSKLDIETDQLHSAAGKAAQTLAGSVVLTVVCFALLAWVMRRFGVELL